MTGDAVCRVTLTRVGWRACLTDLGRSDAERRGVPAGGALDRHSASVANILAGNPRGAVLVEAIGPLAVVPDRPLLVAVTGAPASVAVNGCRAEQWHPIVLAAGQQLEIGPGRDALRTYLAIGGALDAARFLGSAAPDPRMGFGAQLGSGDTLTLSSSRPESALHQLGGTPFRFAIPRFELAEGPVTLHVVPAAEHDRIAGIGELIAASDYTVKPESDHVGLRLSGPVVHLDRGEIVSHGVPVGAVEIPHADDELILLGRYRTLTAGYPIVGVIARHDLDLLGQLTAGRVVRFQWTSRAEAVARTAAREASLAALERSVAAAFAARIGPHRPTASSNPPTQPQTHRGSP